MADKVKAIDGVKELTGQVVAILGDSERLFVTVPNVGRVYVPKELGIKAGTELVGECSLQEETWNNNEDGTAKTEPLVRVAMVSYQSVEAKIKLANAKFELAKANAKVKAMDSYVFTAEDARNLVSA